MVKDDHILREDRNPAVCREVIHITY